MVPNSVQRRRPVNLAILGLCDDHRLLHPPQKLPRVGQCQPKTCDNSEITELTKLEDVQALLPTRQGTCPPNAHNPARP
jgi:hypothetical protein